MTALQYLCYLRPVGECIARQTRHLDTLQNLKRATANHACLSWFRHRVNVTLAHNYEGARRKAENQLEKEPCPDCPFDDTVSEYWVICRDGLQVFCVCVLCNNLVQVTDAFNY